MEIVGSVIWEKMKKKRFCGAFADANVMTAERELS